MSSMPSRNLLFAGLTAVFIGYLMVWLPGPAAGLTFLGVEIGEWIKFLGVGQSRDLFYLPPITLGLMLALITTAWPNDRWRTWIARLLAFGTSLLAFPSIEAIRFEPPSEWLLRLGLIALVAAVALLSGLVARAKSSPWLAGWTSIVLMLIGIVGATLPTWMYLSVRPIVSRAIGLPVGIGPGVWLNGLGHLLVTAVVLSFWLQSVKKGNRGRIRVGRKTKVSR